MPLTLDHGVAPERCDCPRGARCSGSRVPIDSDYEFARRGTRDGSCEFKTTRRGENRFSGDEIEVVHSYASKPNRFVGAIYRRRRWKNNCGRGCCVCRIPDVVRCWVRTRRTPRVRSVWNRRSVTYDAVIRRRPGWTRRCTWAPNLCRRRRTIVPFVTCVQCTGTHWTKISHGTRRR